MGQEKKSGVFNPLKGAFRRVAKGIKHAGIAAATMLGLVSAAPAQVVGNPGDPIITSGRVNTTTVATMIEGNFRFEGADGSFSLSAPVDTLGQASGFVTYLSSTVYNSNYQFFSPGSVAFFDLPAGHSVSQGTLGQPFGQYNHARVSFSDNPAQTGNYFQAFAVASGASSNPIGSFASFATARLEKDYRNGQYIDVPRDDFDLYRLTLDPGASVTLHYNLDTVSDVVCPSGRCLANPSALLKSTGPDGVTSDIVYANGATVTPGHHQNHFEGSFLFMAHPEKETTFRLGGVVVADAYIIQNTGSISGNIIGPYDQLAAAVPEPSPAVMLTLGVAVLGAGALSAKRRKESAFGMRA